MFLMRGEAMSNFHCFELIFGGLESGAISTRIPSYPVAVVNIQKAIENGPCIVSFPSYEMVIFHSFLLVYQRVDDSNREHQRATGFLK